MLDLRNNPGGYLDTAIDVASQFLPNGKLVMQEKYGDGHIDKYNAKGGGLALDLPMVVLIDGGSASASEIVAGALQDNQRASLVGATSYGKGTVQQIHQLSDNGGYIRVTIARWLTPNGRSIDEVGITPNVSVPLTKDDKDRQTRPAVRQGHQHPEPANGRGAAAADGDERSRHSSPRDRQRYVGAVGDEAIDPGRREAVQIGLGINGPGIHAQAARVVPGNAALVIQQKPDDGELRAAMRRPGTSHQRRPSRRGQVQQPHRQLRVQGLHLAQALELKR